MKNFILAILVVATSTQIHSQGLDPYYQHKITLAVLEGHQADILNASEEHSDTLLVSVGMATAQYETRKNLMVLIEKSLRNNTPISQAPTDLNYCDSLELAADEVMDLVEEAIIEMGEDTTQYLLKVSPLADLVKTLLVMERDCLQERYETLEAEYDQMQRRDWRELSGPGGTVETWDGQDQTVWFEGYSIPLHQMPESLVFLSEHNDVAVFLYDPYRVFLSEGPHRQVTAVVRGDWDYTLWAGQVLWGHDDRGNPFAVDVVTGEDLLSHRVTRLRKAGNAIKGRTGFLKWELVYSR